MDTTSWIDRIEQAARLVLWLAIASACVIVPVSYVNQKRAETKAEEELKESVKKAEARAAELEKENQKALENKPLRLTLASMGTYMSAISYSSAQGNLWFTNVSRRAGMLCVVGQAQEPDGGGKTSESLPACQEVGAYAAVRMSLVFAGGDLTAACPKSNCRLTFREAPDARE